MTELEQRAVRALRGVKVYHKGWHDARVKELNMWLDLKPEAWLGCTQQADLWFLVWRYRRQIADREVVTHADELVHGVKILPLE